MLSSESGWGQSSLLRIYIGLKDIQVSHHRVPGKILPVYGYFCISLTRPFMALDDIIYSLA